MNRRIYIAISLLAVGCSAGPTPPPTQASSPVPTADQQTMDASVPNSADASGAEETPDAGNSTDGSSLGLDGSAGQGDSAADGKVAREGPPACPEGMVLVEGDYCTKVKQQCIRSWHDKANDKEVCEEFKPPSVCIGKRVHKRFCIDKYAWPNKKGERPEVMNNFYQAQVKCAAVGKRMCTESEWTFACEGPEMKPFPYGYVRDPHKCNGDHPWDGPKMKKVAKRDPHELARLWKGVRSGSQPECISDFGVADLPGNNDEVVANEHLTGRHAKFSSVHTGGPWYKGVRNQCRPKIYTHDEGFYYYYLGFRCCSNPDGQLNDPRTPMQIKHHWKFSRVERLARFTVEEMKEKLRLKEQGRCTCAPRDILCKTMCGTLLGPEAKDADLKGPR